MNILYVPRREDRILDRFILDDTPHKSVLLVEGARQVGKTWLVQHALRNAGKPTFEVNLERDSLLCSEIDDTRDFREFEDLLEDRLRFSSGSYSILFIDEAQESRVLGRYVRFMKEEWPKTTSILSGSTLTRLFRRDMRYPVGRVQRLVLWPFAFSEFLMASGKEHLVREIQKPSADVSAKRHQTLLSLYDRFLEVGGLPLVVRACFKGEDYQKVRAQIVADYEQDFVRLFGEESMHIVMGCLRSVANLAGSASKNTAVIPSPTTTLNSRINEIFTRLEAWHLIIRSEQGGPSPQGSYGYLPKRYLFDTGIMRHLRESAVPSISVLNTIPAAARTPLGGVLENQLAVDLVRSFGGVSGWKKSSSGTEIDFVLKRADTSSPVECKATLTVNKRHLRGVVDYLDLYSLLRGYIVSFAPSVSMKIGYRTILNTPAYLAEAIGKLAM